MKRLMILACVAIGIGACLALAFRGSASSRARANTVKFIPIGASIHPAEGATFQFHLMNRLFKPIHGEIVRTEIETNNGWQVASNFPSLPPGVCRYPPMFSVDESNSIIVSVPVPSGSEPWRAVFRHQLRPTSSEAEAAVRLVSRKLAAKLYPRPWITNTSERITR